MSKLDEFIKNMDEFLSHENVSADSNKVLFKEMRKTLNDIKDITQRRKDHERRIL